MKQKTIDLLLDCYIKERIPDADTILKESTSDVPVLKERSHTFSFAPTPPQYVCQVSEEAKDVSSLAKEGSHTFSFGPTPPAYQLSGMCTQGLIHHRPLVSADVTDGFHAQAGCSVSADVIDDKKEEQKCREVARKLAKMADEFQKQCMNSSRDGSMHSFTEEHENGCTPEERNALERIYSGGASQSVSVVASVITSCFTPHTLQAAVQYLSGQSDDVSQQFALTLELSTHVVRVMGGKVLGTIRNVVTETFQHCAELEDL